MNTPRKQQRGVVTLIGALFIIIVMVVLAQTINRMSASGMVDTALQNDAVEALFIAESGVEYASAVYAGGTTCAGLSLIGNTNVGRGSFSVSNAYLVGSDCRIEVQASITPLVAGVTPAARTIRADLRLAGGDGWAVGNNGALLRWDGATWNAFASGTSEDLHSVHCVTSNDCRAVGDNSTILHWDGSAWTQFTAPPNRNLLGVSCAPLDSGNCYAVGYTPFFFPIGRTLHWDGSWSDAAGTFWFNLYTAVSCTSSDCFSTMAGGSVNRSSTGWGTVFNGSILLNGIDCASDTQCWAVGNLSGNSYYFVRNNGGSWSSLTVPAPNQARSDLNAVSCAAVDDCWAVGDRDNSRYVVVHWNGSTWSEASFQNGQHREDLNGVHCASASNCWAVGNQRNGWNLIHYGGSGWTYIGSAAAGTENLNDVYLSSGGGGGGAVSLVGWQEVVVN